MVVPVLRVGVISPAKLRPIAKTVMQLIRPFTIVSHIAAVLIAIQLLMAVVKAFSLANILPTVRLVPPLVILIYYVSIVTVLIVVVTPLRSLLPALPR